MKKKRENMYRHILWGLVLLFLVACGTGRQLRKTFEGRPVEVLRKTFGEPVTIIEKEQEKIYIFERTEELKSTEINRGEFTLDPVITPKVTKTERYFFTVSGGIITDTRFVEAYEREK